MLTRGELVARLRAAGCVLAEREADLLLAEGRGRRWLADAVAARAGGTPLEQVLGWAGFAGHRWRVRPGVFVPRRRSERLVAVALGLPRPALAVDVCCGSGALGGALARALAGSPGPPLELRACDVDPVAVACARENLTALAGPRLSVGVHRGDLLDALPARLRGRVDLLLAVVPYVPRDAVALLPPEFRDHEPRRALDGGPDGLDVLRRLAGQAPSWLAPGGHLVTEVGAPQAPAATAVLRGAGLAVRTEPAAGPADPDDPDDPDDPVLVATVPSPP
ncbi:putative protein N(5)-glutamine methyltransferase [Kineococcus sp. SYSU DK004]|uniref:putative protein N(5)-glutamine methyltransferase n=1 Tax=Kineococcus sp. SYSU DK004 TaxID=3383125 RepID=UPI003D7CAE17